MTNRTDTTAPDAMRAPGVPDSLADVALIDARRICAAAGIGKTKWHELVREGRAPQPVIRGQRCTRWRVADVRAWLIELAGPSEPTGSARGKRGGH